VILLLGSTAQTHHARPKIPVPGDPRNQFDVKFGPRNLAHTGLGQFNDRSVGAWQCTLCLLVSPVGLSSAG